MRIGVPDDQCCQSKKHWYFINIELNIYEVAHIQASGCYLKVRLPDNKKNSPNKQNKQKNPNPKYLSTIGIWSCNSAGSLKKNLVVQLQLLSNLKYILCLNSFITMIFPEESLCVPLAVNDIFVQLLIQLKIVMVLSERRKHFVIRNSR